MNPSDVETAYWVIAGSIIGFLVLAFILLYPVHRFLNREEHVSHSWTQDEIARRQQGHGDGSTHPEPESPGKRPSSDGDPA